MSARMFVLCCIWFVVAIPWILITSTLDKEWMIDEGGVKNICDVLEYLENDDTRDVGVILTLPPFSLFSGSRCGEKRRLVYVRHRTCDLRLLAVAVFPALSVLFVAG
nr:YjeO family protein [Escherichia coli]